MHQNLEQQLLPLFANRIVGFDTACSKTYAEVLLKCRHAGVSIAAADAFIAAIALANGFTLATRDVGPFIAAGIRVINPWEILF